MNTIVPIVVTGLLLLLGGLLLFDAVKNWLKYRESDSWQPASAQIVSSRVTVHRSGKGGTSYGMSITYAYQVMGREYQGKQYRFGSDGIVLGTRQKAEAAVAQNPTGKQITIYYDPNAPEQAVFERKFDTTTLVLGIFFLGLGGYISLIVIRNLLAALF